MKKILRFSIILCSALFLTALLVELDFAFWGVGCSRKKAVVLQNKSIVTTIMTYLQDHKDVYKHLPKRLTDLDKVDEFTSKQTNIYYSKKGFKDKDGNIWLVVLKDKENAGRFFVGNINKWEKVEMEIIENDSVLEKAIRGSEPAKLKP